MTQSYAPTYIVWDHWNLEPRNLLAPDAPGGPVLSYGYWITEMGDPVIVSGFYFARRRFRWERRDGPLLDRREAEDEARHPPQALDFGDFPRLGFERDPLVLRELQRVHDVHFGLRTPEQMELPRDAPVQTQVELLEAQFDEFLSYEAWSPKYTVTEEYCLYQRHWLRRLLG